MKPQFERVAGVQVELKPALYLPQNSKVQPTAIPR